MYKLIDLSYVFAFTKSLTANGTFSIAGIEMKYSQSNLLKYVGLIIPVFSAIRLAKFNNDTRQSDTFIGLPTPANATLIAGFCFLVCKYNFNLSDVNSMMELEQRFQAMRLLSGIVVANFLSSPGLLCIVSIALSFLLVSEVPLIALKFKNFSWNENRIKYFFY